VTDLIERLRDYDPIEQQLRGLPIQQEAADEIERLEDGRICLKFDIDNLQAEIERLTALVNGKRITNDGLATRVNKLEKVLEAAEKMGYHRQSKLLSDAIAEVNDE
jgi:septal ring factor EnvC (AmiA/AmiB activator)